MLWALHLLLQTYLAALAARPLLVKVTAAAAAATGRRLLLPPTAAPWSIGAHCRSCTL